MLVNEIHEYYKVYRNFQSCRITKMLEMTTNNKLAFSQHEEIFQFIWTLSTS